MKKAVEVGSFKGIKVIVEIFISHLFFVDDVLILGDANLEEWKTFHSLLTNFFQASGMVINCQKSCFLTQNIDLELEDKMRSIFNIQFMDIEDGMK